MVLGRSGWALPFDLRQARLDLSRLRVPDLLLHVDHVPDNLRARNFWAGSIREESVVVHRHGHHGRRRAAESNGRRRRSLRSLARLLDRVEHTNDTVIRTGWGGVVITRHEHPRVEKYLVVRKGGYLALETHEQKDERLDVREGAGLILWRPANEQSLTVEVLRRGAEFHFQPGMEHCIIGAEDLLVFERSIDPKGMDQDLIFIYEPDAIVSPLPSHAG